MISDIELEAFEITIEVYDQNDFLANDLVGAASVGKKKIS